MVYLFSDYESSSNSKICIITAGAGASDDENKAEVVKRNTDIFKGIISQVVTHSPDCILLVVTYPGMYGVKSTYNRILSKINLDILLQTNTLTAKKIVSFG